MVIDSILNTTAAVLLHHDHVCIVSVTRRISSPPPQTLTFQVKVPQNTLFFLLIQHLLWFPAVTDLEGSMYPLPLFHHILTRPSLIYLQHFSPLQLISNYLRVSKNIDKVQLQIGFEDYWQHRESLLYQTPPISQVSTPAVPLIKPRCL